MVLLSLTMLILELSIGVAWWPGGKIIGVIISMLCLFISLINFSSVAITLGKALLGFVFIILSAAFSDDFNVGGYLIMGFLGAYLLVDSALYFIPDSDFVLMINNRFGSIKNNYIMFYFFTLLPSCLFRYVHCVSAYQ